MFLAALSSLLLILPPIDFNQPAAAAWNSIIRTAHLTVQKFTPARDSFTLNWEFIENNL